MRARSLLKLLPVFLLLLSFTLFTGDSEPVRKNSEIFAAFFSETNKYFVDEPDPAKLARAAIDGAMKSLDPYSHFVSEVEQEDNRKGWKGVLFAGIGVNLIVRDSQVVLTSISPGYPAEKSGLRCGDILLESDGFNLKGISLDSLLGHLRGKKGTSLTLKVKRESEAPFEKILIREDIVSKAVPCYFMLDEKTGYIRFIHFLEGSSELLRQAFLSLKNQGMQNLVLDIRGNSGGLVMESVDASNIFISKGKNILSVKGRTPEWNYENPAKNEALDTLMPLALLTDESSISAAEILSGAIQDYDRGVIVGRRTFGKGFVQGSRYLPYGNSVYLTMARYYTPSGRCLQELDYTKRDSIGKATHLADSLKKSFFTVNGRKVNDKGGVTPDVAVKLHSSSAVINAMKQSYLLFDFANHYRNTHPAPEKNFKFSLSEEQLQEFFALVKSKNYPYQTPAEESLNAFTAKLSEEKNNITIKTNLDLIRKEFIKNKSAEIQKYRSEIKTELEKEIMERYYFYEGRLMVTLMTDSDAIAARVILNDEKQYKELLKIKN